jgi:glutamate formiminotransferase
MTLLAIPNCSEGTDRRLIDDLISTVESSGAGVLDVHADPVHNRCVLTVTASAPELIDAMGALAVATRAIDLSHHRGVHPRLGGLDVCPIVPHHEPMATAVRVARAAAEEIAGRASLPVFLYGDASPRLETRHLPDIRRGGLEALAQRVKSGFRPDFGPGRIDPRVGVACVGARPVLIAFNVLLRGDLTTARQIAAAVRDAGTGVRALGLPTAEADRSQVSMNLTRPHETGIDEAFDQVARLASSRSVQVVGTEIVGLPPERFLPDPSAQAARLLVRPGRSLESVLQAGRR